MKVKYRLKSIKTGNYIHFVQDMIQWGYLSEATEFNSLAEIEKHNIVNPTSIIVEAFLSND